VEPARRDVLKLERGLHVREDMTTTLGQLVSDLYDKYERSYGDEMLATLATQARIVEMLRNSELRRCSRATRPAARHRRNRR
jgi:hypothetical protein